MKTPRIERVEVVHDHEEHTITVWPYWTAEGLDRRQGTGFGLTDSPAHKRLSQRMVNAILADAVFYKPEIRTDTHGKTYVHASSRVMGKYMNADLKRLGF